jgi:CRP/FNR family transcriptional regulator, cyclic AMP receptor protein
VAEARPTSTTTGFLGLLDPADRSELIALGRLRRYRPRTPLIIEGDPGDSVFVLLAGRVKITVDTPEGREVVLAVDGPGDAIGYFEAIDLAVGPRVATITALEPVACRVLTGDEFRAFLDAHPSVAVVLLRWVIRRLWTADHRRIEFGSLDVAHRLARFILELADRHGRPDLGGIDVDIPLTQDELASLISASRDSVVRALTSLRARGLVSTARRKLTITDVGGLRRYGG